MVKINHILLISIIFITHLLLINLPPINLEFVFADASRYFENGDKNLIDQYFRLQANTLGLPYLSWVLSYLSPNIDFLTLIRLLSASGNFLLGIAIINFCRHLKRDDSITLLILILLNPLVWIFSSRATADFFPAALGIFAISIVVNQYLSISRILCCGLLLGIAAILKYHSILLLIFLIPFLWNFKNKIFDFISFFTISFISISLVLIFLVVIHENYGFWVTPPAFQSIHRISLIDVINNFFLYIGFLILLCAPISLAIDNFKSFFVKYKFLILIGIFLIFTIGYIGFQDRGELNLGPLDRFLNKNLMAGIFLLLSSLFLMPLFFNSSNEEFKHFNILLAIAILVVIFIFSLSRPAQRYLLVILPFFFFLVPKNIISNKIILITTISLLTFANIFLVYSQWCTGTASIKMVDAVRAAGLINVTHPGVIEGHIGNKFDINLRSDSKYIIVNGENPDAYIKVSSGIFLFKKRLSLINITQ